MFCCITNVQTDGMTNDNPFICRNLFVALVKTQSRVLCSKISVKLAITYMLISRHYNYSSHRESEAHTSSQKYSIASTNFLWICQTCYTRHRELQNTTITIILAQFATSLEIYMYVCSYMEIAGISHMYTHRYFAASTEVFKRSIMSINLSHYVNKP